MGLGDEKLQFEKRLRRIARKERRMQRGSVMHFRSDGLVIVKPQRRDPIISYRSMLLFLAAFVVFKAVVMVELGSSVYRAHVIKLSQGSTIEQAGAWVMSADPASALLADTIRPYLR